MNARSSTTVDDDVLRLLLAGGRLAAAPGVQLSELDRVVARLTARDPAVDSRGLALELLGGLLPPLWESGWQPADLVHVVGRAVTQRAGRLAAVLVAADAATRDTAPAPAPWLDQLAELDGPVRTVAGWWQAEGVAPAAAWRDVLRVLGVLRGLPPLEPLLPPPSAWSSTAAVSWAWSGSPALSVAAGDPRVLGRIRALLAKAESTDFDAEAEALTAKAQQLMARHAIDSAMPVGTGAGPSASPTVTARRLHLSDPHAEAKAAIVQAVGTANDVRVVLLPAYGIATLVGVPGDIGAVELMVTSLLVQAGRAMALAAGSGGPRTRSTAFRRGFLYSFAQRVGERLATARDDARAEAAVVYGTALAPVLADRSAAVDRAVDELFPRVRRRRGPSVDPAGWDAGRRAAVAADLDGVRTQLPG